MDKVILGAGKEIYKYFRFSQSNVARTSGLIAAILIVPAVNSLIPKLLEENHNTSSNPHLISALKVASIINMISGLQASLTQMMATSLTQAIRANNVRMLTDDNKFLLYAHTEDITSIQYIAVGVGARDFANHSVLMFITLPMYIASSIVTCANIISISDAKTVTATLVFATITNLCIYVLARQYFSYQAHNQIIENELVAKVSFIEENKHSISLIGAVDKIGHYLAQDLNKITNTIPKITGSNFLYVFLMQLTYTIGGQFLGGYYPSLNPNNLSINAMLMSLLLNMQSTIAIATDSYVFLKLNLKQLNAFFKAYEECKSIKTKHNKITIIYNTQGNKLKLDKLKIYKPLSTETPENQTELLFDEITLDLPTNKIYKLSAPSGTGKTTFLRSITDNWQYLDGHITLPLDSKDNMYFIPQNPLIPPGTLLEIITYPLKPNEFIQSEFMSVILLSNFIYLHPDNQEESDNDDSDLNMPSINNGVCRPHSYNTNISFVYNTLIQEAKSLLTRIGINEAIISELESEGINWAHRLSGGEKQKLCIIRALLCNPSFLVMDEAVSSLDEQNKQLAYSITKEFITTKEDYIIIYTDHGDTNYFGDNFLTLSSQGIILENLEAPSN